MIGLSLCSRRTRFMSPHPSDIEAEGRESSDSERLSSSVFEYRYFLLFNIPVYINICFHLNYKHSSVLGHINLATWSWESLLLNSRFPSQKFTPIILFQSSALGVQASSALPSHTWVLMARGSHRMGNTRGSRERSLHHPGAIRWCLRETPRYSCDPWT